MVKYNDVAERVEVFESCLDLALEAGATRARAIEIAGQAVEGYADHLSNTPKLDYEKCEYLKNMIIEFCAENVKEWLKQD